MDSSQVAMRLAAYDNYRKQGVSAQGDKSSDRYQFRAKRMCQDDVLMCVWAYRLRRKQYEVGLFLAEDHYRYVKWSGVMGGLIFILSDAYFKTGCMEVHFCGPHADARPNLNSGFEGSIPKQIRDYAASIGINLPRGRVLPDTLGRRIFAAITDLPKTTERRLEHSGCDLTRACFLINRGIWTREQMALIARWTREPSRILQGGSPPEEWMNLKAELLMLRFAILHERLHTLLCGLLEQGRAQATSTWLAPNRACFSLREASRLALENGTAVTFPKGSQVEARFIARHSPNYGFYLQKDLELVGVPNGSRPVVIVVTKDFDWIGRNSQNALRNAAKSSGGNVVQVVDTLTEIDEFVTLKLFQTASSRRPVQERPE
jgi:hypothetical protein